MNLKWYAQNTIEIVGFLIHLLKQQSVSWLMLALGKTVFIEFCQKTEPMDYVSFTPQQELRGIPRLFHDRKTHLWVIVAA